MLSILSISIGKLGCILIRFIPIDLNKPDLPSVTDNRLSKLTKPANGRVEKYIESQHA